MRAICLHGGLLGGLHERQILYFIEILEQLAFKVHVVNEHDIVTRVPSHVVVQPQIASISDKQCE